MKPPAESKKPLYMIREFRLVPDWYADRYPDAVLTLQSGQFRSYQDHFEALGQAKFYSPSPYFCSTYYARQSKFKDRVPKWGLIEDYLRYGAAKMLSPHWLFSEQYFLESHPEAKAVRDAGNLVSGYQHYIRRVGSDQALGRPSPLFNKAYYLEQLGRAPQRDAFYDFISQGNAQGIPCSPLFDADWYGSRYPELKAVAGQFAPFESLLQHFAEHGLHEGKLPIPDFDPEYYAKENPDIERGDWAKRPAFHHFLYKGIAEGRRPNRFFDTDYYLEHNPEVARELKTGGFLGAFEHFLAVGIKRNYKACAPLISMAVNEDAAKALYEKRCRIQGSLFKSGPVNPWPEPEAPVLSAIVPVFNHFDYTASLLQQLRLFAAANPSLGLEVIVVDNGSTDETPQLVGYMPGIKLLRFPAPMGYPAACNAGAAAARGKVLLFLNNDIEIMPGSLERIVGAFESEQDLGALGGKIIKMNCQLQEAGGIIWNDGSTWGYGRGDNPLSPRYQFRRDVDYCSGCFLAVEADLFHKLGQFDEQFSPGYYEETDLCARIWSAGRRVVYDPAISITHYEYASFSSGRPETIAVGLMARNKEKFVRKNRAFLATRPRFSPDKADSAASRSGPHMPRVLFIEDLVPRREIGSGFCRSEDMVREFLAAGWWVTIWAMNKLPGIEPVDHPLCEVVYATEQKGGLDAYLRKSPTAFALIWLCRTHNLRGYADAIARWRGEHPQGKVICDSEAVASVRPWLSKELGRGTMPDLKHIEAQIPLPQLEREMKGHIVADAFVAVSELDMKLISLVTSGPVKILGHKMPLRMTPNPFEERKDLLFCGAVHEEGSPNYDSLIWFVNRVAPILKRDLPGVKLKVVGYWRPSVPIPPMLYDDSVELIGPVNDLTPYFAKARLFVAPTRVAAGIPHKVHESMGLGLPVVVTPILDCQLQGFGSEQAPAYFAAQNFSPEAFAKAIVAAYSDAERWNRVRASAAESLDKHCSAEGFSMSFNQIMSSVLGQPA